MGLTLNTSPSNIKSVKKKYLYDFSHCVFFRPFIANLLPCIARISVRVEESIQVQQQTNFNRMKNLIN